MMATIPIPVDFVVVATVYLHEVLELVQLDRREHALRVSLRMHCLADNAYGAGLDDLANEARRAEVDAIRWRCGDDPAGSRERIARSAQLLLRRLRR